MKTIRQFNSYITCPKPSPQASLRLFCFPYAGGSSLVFRRWAESLPKNIEICPVELPGRGTQMKSSPFSRMEALVNAIAPILLLYLDKPFAFFGHSMGGLVSFELARHLRKEYGKKPVQLFVSASRAPHIPSPSGFSSYSTWGDPKTVLLHQSHLFTHSQKLSSFKSFAFLTVHLLQCWKIQN